MRTRLALPLSLVLTAAGLTVATPADAAVRDGCSYPYVCLYAGRTLTHPTGRFRDITSG